MTSEAGKEAIVTVLGRDVDIGKIENPKLKEVFEYVLANKAGKHGGDYRDAHDHHSHHSDCICVIGGA